MLTVRIDIEKSRVTLFPETAEERAKVEAVWRILVDCVGDSRKLVPIGEYIPHKDENASASFHIEGLDPEEHSFADVTVQDRAQVHCRICNKLLSLEAGDTIPVCCGKMMEVID